MGYREGSSKLSKHRRMSRAASLAIEAEGIPLSRYVNKIQNMHISNIIRFTIIITRSVYGLRITCNIMYMAFCFSRVLSLNSFSRDVRVQMTFFGFC